MELAEDLAIFMDDFALPVTVQGETFPKGGIWSEPVEYVTEQGEVAVSDYALLVRADQLGHLRMGMLLTVNGVAFRVRRDARKRVDGAFAEVLLMRMGSQLPPEAVGPTPIGNTSSIDGNDLVVPGGVVRVD